MRYFVIADIHGFYEEMLAALNAAGFDKDNPEHFLISLGDACDRGPASHKVVKYLLDLPKDRRVLIKGNHWDLLEAAIKNNCFEAYDYSNGTVKTMAQFTGMSEFDPPTSLIRECFYSPLYRKYRGELVDYYETDNYIFCHGYIPCDVRVDYEQRKLVRKYKFDENWRDGNWRDAAWFNAYDVYKQGVKVEGKTVVAGHWHCSYAWSKELGIPEHGKGACYDIYKEDGLVMLDACTVVSKKVNVTIIED